MRHYRFDLKILRCLHGSLLYGGILRRCFQTLALHRNLYYNGKKIRKTENSAIQGAKESGRQLKIPRAEAECAPSEQFVQGRGVNAPASARVKGAKGYGVAVPKQSGTAVVRLCILCIL